MRHSRTRPIQACAIAAGATLLASTAVLAADLPSRRIAPVIPPIPAPAAYNWTGFYVGVSAGADFLNNNWRTNGLGTGFNLDGRSQNAGFNETRARLGGFVGYNYQISTFVLGVEGDGAYDFGSRKRRTGVPGTIAFVGTPNDDSINASSRYDASVRGRLGYLVTPTILAYATGGVAFRDNSYGINCAGDGFSWCSRPENGSFGGTRTGYTVGGGLEGVVFNNVTVRIEYRYSDFGSRSLGFFGPANSAAGDFFDVRTRMSASTVTLGLAYKFDLGLPVAPVVARY